MEHKYYVEKPDLQPYEGIVVTKDTKLKFKNKFVEQSLENLEFKSKMVNKTERYTSTQIVEIHLKEGEIILEEKEKRGYFVASDNTPVEEISIAIQDLKSLKEALTGKDA